MLDHAASIGTARPVQWQVADAQRLPFGDGEFDAVLCQFGAMFFPEKSRAFAEARRVLRRGGRFLFSVWDHIEHNAFWASIRAGRSGISHVTSFDTNELKARCCGVIRDWDPTVFFPPHRLKRLDRYAQFSVASALLAVATLALFARAFFGPPQRHLAPDLLPAERHVAVLFIVFLLILGLVPGVLVAP